MPPAVGRRASPGRRADRWPPSSGTPRTTGPTPRPTSRWVGGCARRAAGRCLTRSSIQPPAGASRTAGAGRSARLRPWISWRTRSLIRIFRSPERRGLAQTPTTSQVFGRIACLPATAPTTSRAAQRTTHPSIVDPGATLAVGGLGNRSTLARFGAPRKRPRNGRLRGWGIPPQVPVGELGSASAVEHGAVSSSARLRPGTPHALPLGTGQRRPARRRRRQTTETQCRRLRRRRDTC